jgi:hypothetical protein
MSGRAFIAGEVWELARMSLLCTRIVAMEYLFSSGDLQSELADEARKAPAIVDGVDPDMLLDRTDDENMIALMQAHAVAKLAVSWDQAWSPGPRETRVDMQRDFRYRGL